MPIGHEQINICNIFSKNYQLDDVGLDDFPEIYRYENGSLRIVGLMVCFYSDSKYNQK